MALVWDDSLCVGVKIIDKQHMQLLERANKLAEAIEHGCTHEEIRQVMGFLEEYVVWHFSIEEQYMRKGYYPGYRDHWETHMAFISDLESIKVEVNNSPDPTVIATQIQNRLYDWFVNHISKQDRELADFLNVGTKRLKRAA